MTQQFYLWINISKLEEKTGTQHHYSKELKVKATQMSTEGWMDKQNMLYTYNVILFCLKKEILAGHSNPSYLEGRDWEDHSPG
jgi:hypothetical protein